MCTIAPDALSADDILHGHFRRALRELRERYGPQPWLTVVSGPVAEAARLSRLPGEEFFELIQDQLKTSHGLALYMRSPNILRLRLGFDNHSMGGLGEKDGVMAVNLSFDGRRNNVLPEDEYCVASYGEEGRAITCEKGRIRVHEPHDCRTLSVASPSLSEPDIPRLIGRPVASLFPKAPRFLRAASTRIASASYTEDPVNRNTLELTLSTHWETLALMPAEVSRELGIGPQRTTDQMPWLGAVTHVREPLWKGSAKM